MAGRGAGLVFLPLQASTELDWIVLASLLAIANNHRVEMSVLEWFRASEPLCWTEDLCARDMVHGYHKRQLEALDLYDKTYLSRTCFLGSLAPEATDGNATE